MSVLIKDIDKELYAKFKASAALHGLRLNDALCEAIKCWIDNNSPKNHEDIDRIRNNATYRRLASDLLPDHENEWVLISNGELLGLFPDRMQAIKKVEEDDLYNKSNLISPLTLAKRQVTLGFGRKIS